MMHSSWLSSMEHELAHSPYSPRHVVAHLSLTHPTAIMDSRSNLHPERRHSRAIVDEIQHRRGL